MATNVVTNGFDSNQIEQLLQSDEHYYFFVGNFLPYSGNTTPQANDTTQAFLESYRNMIMGKRLGSADMNPIIRRVVWESNTIYDMYDDRDMFLQNKDYYVSVTEGGYFHIYKCLDNNNRAASTFQPTFSHITGGNTAVYRTADGYQWKYMYSFTAAHNGKFGTEELMPVMANTDVSQSAVRGAIDVILVEGHGSGFDNYLSGTFVAQQIRVNGNNTLYEINNNQINFTNSFYSGCLLYMATGNSAGVFASVTNSYSNSTGNYIVLEQPLDIIPSHGDQWQLYPEVVVHGAGTETERCRARALVNSLASNSVYRVEIVSRGAGYEYGVTANAIYSAVVGAVPVELRVIIPPGSGHGYDAKSELGCHAIEFSCRISNSESNTLLTTNDYRQIGLIQNPQFANVVLEIANLHGAFLLNENIYKVQPRRIEVGVTINTTSNLISCNTADFQYQLSNNDYLYIQTSTDQQLAQISSVVNSSAAVLTSNGKIESGNAVLYLANLVFAGHIDAVNGTHLTVSKLQGGLHNDDLIVGSASHARMNINTISRSGEFKQFDTFIQLSKYVGTVLSGTFVEDELVFQTSLQQANAYLHSAVIDTGVLSLYTGLGEGIMETNNKIIGNTSGAVANIASKFGPELIFGSGRLLYLENIDQVSRNANSSEVFQIIFEY